MVFRLLFQILIHRLSQLMYENFGTFLIISKSMSERRVSSAVCVRRNLYVGRDTVLHQFCNVNIHLTSVFSFYIGRAFIFNIQYVSYFIIIIYLIHREDGQDFTSFIYHLQFIFGLYTTLYYSRSEAFCQDSLFSGISISTINHYIFFLDRGLLVKIALQWYFNENKYFSC